MLALNSQHLREFNDVTPAREVVLLDQGHDMIPFDRIECRDLRRIGAAWLRMPREGRRRLPRWEMFRPADFKPVLDKFCVLRVHDWRADEIEFSLYGGHPTDFIGSGKPLVMQDMRHDPLRSANYYDIRDRAGRAVDYEAPQYVRKTLSWNDKNYIEYETLMLPFEPGKGTRRVLQPVSARARLRLVHSDRASSWCEVIRRKTAYRS